jgi:hypothetical protein
VHFLRTLGRAPFVLRRGKAMARERRNRQAMLIVGGRKRFAVRDDGVCILPR